MASTDQDASKDSAKNQSSASSVEAGPPEEESTPAAEQLTQKKRGNKRRREEREGKKKKTAQTASPLERPSRERKSVVRYSATESRILTATKALKIQQGPGEMLKDIPNVTFKLSKRKSDESLRLLHKILFGRKANVHYLKRNILQFSGFVWSQNEEKEKSKVREKLNKCNKERLLDFCDLLDVYTLKVTTKKEEISAKLLEFLESPHATREVLLSEKDTKGKKRRRVAKGTQEKPLEEASSDKEITRPKKDNKHVAKKARKKPSKDFKEDQGKDGGSIDINDDESEEKKDDAEEIAEHSNSETEDEDNEHKEPESTKTLSDGEEMDEDEKPKSKEKLPSVRKFSRAKSKKGSSSAASKMAGGEDEAKVSLESKTTKGISKTEKKKSTTKKHSKDNSTGKAPQKKGEVDSGSGLSHRSKKVKEKGKSDARSVSKDKQEKKKQIEKAASKNVNENKKKIAKNASKGAKENKKQIAKTKSKNVSKNEGKPADDIGEPSTEQLHAVVSEILKEVDFNVATLADIIRQLGAHFNTDLMHRKTEIKGILEEVINNMTDDEDDEDDDGNEE